MKVPARPKAERWIILMGLAYWISFSIFIFALHGDELDLDAVFPLFGQNGRATNSYETTPLNPPAAVVAAFWTVGTIVGLPIVVPVQAMVAVLRLSAIAIGICLLVTILRLGIFLAPVLALQLWALQRRDSAA